MGAFCITTSSTRDTVTYIRSYYYTIYKKKFKIVRSKSVQLPRVIRRLLLLYEKLFIYE